MPIRQEAMGEPEMARGQASWQTPPMTCQYEYRTVPMAPAIGATSKKNEGIQAASYLQGIIDEYAVDEWEFYRVDTFVVEQPPGCLGILTGKTVGQRTSHYVATFRRVMRDAVLIDD